MDAGGEGDGEFDDPVGGLFFGVGVVVGFGLGGFEFGQ